MAALELNHASIVAHELEKSVEFYESLFDMQSVPTPNFEVPVQWMQYGDQQLHLFKRDVTAPEYHHLGMTVDDFSKVYRVADNRGLFASWDDNSDGSLYLLPDGAVQMYLADPAGNLIEVDHPDVRSLDESIQAQIVNREELDDQSGDAANATLNL